MKRQVIILALLLIKDKDNEFEEYNPWGRPGGGAPVRTQSGNIVADYKKMHQVKVY